MKRLAAVCLAVLLVACSGVDGDRTSTSTTTTTVEVPTTTVLSPVSTPVSTTLAASTKTLVADTADESGESIGVTDRVTIVVTDPGNG